MQNNQKETRKRNEKKLNGKQKKVPEKFGHVDIFFVTLQRGKEKDGSPQNATEVTLIIHHLKHYNYEQDI